MNALVLVPNAGSGAVLRPGVAPRPCVYAGVVEHSVYVDPAARGLGLGTALIGSTEAGGVWTVQAGIFPENTAGLHLHDRAGFRTGRYARAAGAPPWPPARRRTSMNAAVGR